MDLSGCVFLDKKTEASNDTLNISEWADGVYLLKFTYDSKIIIEKIVKAR
jgi:hypothetical protein